jgi:hypothetical protein
MVSLSPCDLPKLAGHHHRPGVDHAQRLERSRRVVAQVVVERRRGLQRQMMDQDGMAIRRGAGNARCTRCAPGACHVFDHDLLAERAGHVLGEKPRDDVAGPACCKGNNQRDRFGGKALSEGGVGGKSGEAHREGTGCEGQRGAARDADVGRLCDVIGGHVSSP